MSESTGGSVALKFVRVFPCRTCARPSICISRMLRLQPCAMLWRMYHSRSMGSRTRSRSRQLWNHGICAASCCTNARSGQAVRKRPHVLEVAGREAAHLRERLPQVRGEPIDHLRAPARAILPLQDHPPDVPVEQDHGRVDSEDNPKSLLLDPALDLGERRRIITRQFQPRGRHGESRSLAPPPSRAPPQQRASSYPPYPGSFTFAAKAASGFVAS